MKEKIFLAATVIAAAAGIFCFAGDFIKSAEKIDIIDTVIPEQIKDRYGRTLAYLYFPDGTMIQEWLLSNGYANAVTYPPNVKYSEHFSELAHTAIENNVNIAKTVSKAEADKIDDITETTGSEDNDEEMY